MTPPKWLVLIVLVLAGFFVYATLPKVPVALLFAIVFFGALALMRSGKPTHE